MSVSANVSANVNANDMLSQNRRITIRDIAREAGVSTQTVSRVINDHPDVSRDTRLRVAAIVGRLSYHPNELARSLVHQRSRTLGVVTANLRQVGPGRTLNGIASRAEELGYGILLKELPRCAVDDMRPILRFLSTRQVDGILWAAPEVSRNRELLIESLADTRMPAICLSMRAYPGVPVLSIDNYAGGLLATTHLLDLGRKHIAHLSGPLDWWEARERQRGWHDALE